MANRGSDDVTILDADGSAVGSFPAGPRPVEIALDFEGNIWVANDLGATVTRLSSAGGTPTAFAVPNGPRGISVAGDGSLFVSIYDGGAGREVVRLDPDGNELETLFVDPRPVNHGDGTGLVHASCVVPDADADLDGWTNAEEIDLLTNPFDLSEHPVDVTAITPDSGSVNGGTEILIDGRSLELPLEVRVGGRLATVVAPGAGGVVARTPEGAFPPVGLVDVLVTRPDGNSFLAVAAFEYTNDAPVADPDPDSVDDGYYIVPGDSLELDGRDSEDPNEAVGDSIVGYEWDVNGHPLSGANPVVSPEILVSFGINGLGGYDVTLRVTDSVGVVGEATVELVVVPLGSVAFLRGDSNQDSGVDLGDPIFFFRWLFQGGSAPSCRDAADANGDRRLDLADAIWLVRFLFQGFTAPPAPYPVCRPHPLELDCSSSVCSS